MFFCKYGADAADNEQQRQVQHAVIAGGWQLLRYGACLCDLLFCGSIAVIPAADAAVPVFNISLGLRSGLLCGKMLKLGMIVSVKLAIALSAYIAHCLICAGGCAARVLRNRLFTGIAEMIVIIVTVRRFVQSVRAYGALPPMSVVIIHIPGFGLMPGCRNGFSALGAYCRIRACRLCCAAAVIAYRPLRRNFLIFKKRCRKIKCRPAAEDIPFLSGLFTGHSRLLSAQNLLCVYLAAAARVEGYITVCGFLDISAAEFYSSVVYAAVNSAAVQLDFGRSRKLAVVYNSSFKYNPTAEIAVIYASAFVCKPMAECTAVNNPLVINRAVKNSAGNFAFVYHRSLDIHFIFCRKLGIFTYSQYGICRKGVCVKKEFAAFEGDVIQRPGRAAIGDNQRAVVFRRDSGLLGISAAYAFAVEADINAVGCYRICRAKIDIIDQIIISRRLWKRIG